MPCLCEEEWDKIIAKDELMRYMINTITHTKQLKAHAREIRKMEVSYSDQVVDRKV
jgi:DNA-binding IclR family transcriptional regulator